MKSNETQSFLGDMKGIQARTEQLILRIKDQNDMASVRISIPKINFNYEQPDLIQY